MASEVDWMDRINKTLNRPLVASRIGCTGHFVVLSRACVHALLTNMASILVCIRCNPSVYQGVQRILSPLFAQLRGGGGLVAFLPIYLDRLGQEKFFYK